MLEDAKGRSCQATNFSRAFGATSQISALGLFDQEDDVSAVAYASLIQTFNRYLLEQFTVDAGIPGPSPPLIRNASDMSSMSQLLRSFARTQSTCPCGAVTSRETALTSIDMIYPPKVSLSLRDGAQDAALTTMQPLSNEAPPPSDFAAILRNSIHRDSVARLTCATCRMPQHFRIRRDIDTSRLPPILSLNAGVRTADELECWSDTRQPHGKHFINRSFALAREGTTVQVITNEALGLPLSAVSYDLTAMVVQIQAEDDVPHLVCYAKAPSSDGSLSWYLFNDFLVRPVPEEEVFSFPSSWKVGLRRVGSAIAADTSRSTDPCRLVLREARRQVAARPGQAADDRRSHHPLSRHQHIQAARSGHGQASASGQSRAAWPRIANRDRR